MGDLFSPQANKPHHWRFAGCVDDINSLSIAQNVNPIMVEQHISAHATVKTVAMVGNGRPASCLVVELQGTTNAEATMDEIWPTRRWLARGAEL